MSPLIDESDGRGHGKSADIKVSAMDTEQQKRDLDGDLVTATECRDLKRGLKERHLTMLGIAGAIGTGLFLGLGGGQDARGRVPRRLRAGD